MAEIDVDLLEADLKANHTSWQNFKTIFPGVKNALKNGELETVDRTIRDYAAEYLRKARASVNQRIKPLQNNWNAGDAISGLSSLDGNLARLVNSIKGAEFGWSTVGSKFKMNYETMKKLLNHDNRMIDQAANVDNLATSLLQSSDEALTPMITDMKAKMDELDNLLRERVNIMKNFVDTSEMGL